MTRPGPLYASVIPDGPDVVRSVRPNYYYSCPDVSAVDGHMRFLQERYLGPGSGLTESIKSDWRRDFDQLIDHRLWLRFLGEEAA